MKDGHRALHQLVFAVGFGECNYVFLKRIR